MTPHEPQAMLCEDPMVELRSLAYFVTACRSGSFARAAADLDIAVSTLSTTMKTLAEDLGLSLFRRINNNLYPTAAARGLMRTAEPLLIAELFARRLAPTSPKTRLKHLTVEIGLSFTIGGMSSALRRAIDSMGAERPDIFVDLVWADEKDLPHVGALAENWTGAERSRADDRLGRRRSATRRGTPPRARRSMGVRAADCRRARRARRARPT